jgi:hypothetical protein
LLKPDGASRIETLRRNRARNYFVDVAPDPVFSGLDRPDHRMPALMKMFGGMFILRRIAAAHLPAHHTHAQVNPGVADLHAFFADVLVCGCDFDLIQMFAFLCHF